MIYLSIGFLASFLLPSLIGSWRVGFLAIAAQGLILAAALLCFSEDFDLAAAFQTTDLVIIRGIILPVVLISAARKTPIASDFEFVPANFLYWAALSLIVGLGLWFGHLLFPDNLPKALLCGSGASGVATSFFVLSLQTPGIGQVFALLLLENSIVLFEFLSSHHFNPIIQLGVSGLFLALVLVLKMFLKKLPVLTSTGPSDTDRDLI